MKTLKTAEKQYKINVALDEFNEGTISYNTLKTLLDDINGIPLIVQQEGEYDNKEPEIKNKSTVKGAMTISFVISFLIARFMIR